MLNLARPASAVTRADYADRLVRGGLPEAVARTDPRRRGRFLDAYVQNLIDRDFRQLAEIERLLSSRRLSAFWPRGPDTWLHRGASNPSCRSRALPSPGICACWKRYSSSSAYQAGHATSARVPRPHRNSSSSTPRSPPGLESHALRRPGAPFGPLLQSFVLSELARQLTWSHHLADLYHYRDHNKVEVDGILEDRHGQVIGIEVKAASTVRSEDFNGLRQLSAKVGDDFLVGIVLHTGTATLPFGPKLRAVPVSALWQL